jgi:hypothetical protein
VTSRPPHAQSSAATAFATKQESTVEAAAEQGTTPARQLDVVAGLTSDSTSNGIDRVARLRMNQGRIREGARISQAPSALHGGIRRCSSSSPRIRSLS